jgi:hypothetical protein
VTESEWLECTAPEPIQSTGPRNILLTGLVAMFLCLGWFGYHLLRPSTIPRLSRTRAKK